MPWTVKDVDKHKKGLTDAQKKRWVEVANSARAACLKKGKPENECDASAIKQANGVVGNNEIRFTLHDAKVEEAYSVREETHQGRTHLVIPVTMMVEGVHNGSHGPLFHSIEELGKYPGAWDGIPVVVDHPEIDGVNVSANSPGIIDTRTVGRVYNTHVEDTKLKAEAWIDVERLRQVHPATLAMINKREVIEVSVGVFNDEEETAGEWNGETYEAIARNLRPDHLALLPGGTGACSVEDGCGLRSNNNKKGGKNVKKEVFQTMRTLNAEGYAVSQMQGVIANEGYKELVDAARRKLDGMDTNDSYHMLEEVYEDYLVYAVHFRVGESKMYKQGYSFNSGVIELSGDPEEVRKKVEYVANTVQRTKFSINHKKEDNNMSNAKNCPNCLAKVEALISNKDSGWKEADREWLMTQEESVLDRLAPKVIEKTVEKTVDVNKLAPEDAAALAYGKKQMKLRREALVNGIKANTAEGLWTDADLNDMSEEKLEKLFNSVKKEEEVVDFSFGAGNHGLQNNADETEPLYPSDVTFVDSKK